MSILDKLSSSFERRDDAPNKEVAKELIETENAEDIKILVENLDNESKSVVSDCIKVLYEIGYVKPILIADYIDVFLSKLGGKNNRLEWGCMTAISTITEIKHEIIYKKHVLITRAMDKGSQITFDAGIITLSKLAGIKEEYNKRITPLLLHYLKNCDAKKVPSYAESISKVIPEDKKGILSDILSGRRSETHSQSARKRLDKIKDKL